MPAGMAEVTQAGFRAGHCQKRVVVVAGAQYVKAEKIAQTVPARAWHRLSAGAGAKA